DVVEQALGVFGLGDDLDAGVAQQADDALPGEQDVVGDDYPHGSSACSRGGSTVSLPSRAPTRSASWTIDEVRSVPSSCTVTTSRPPPRATLTTAWLAARAAALISTGGGAASAPVARAAARPASVRMAG